jgi:ketosteroid isomerase-like protein
VTAQERTLRAAYEAWNRHDVDAYVATMHPAVEIRPVLGGNLEADLYCGHDGARRWIEDAKGEWETFEANVLEVIERGKRAVSVVRIRARGRASGAWIEGQIFHVALFRDGLIRSVRGFTDRAEALHALESS